MQKEYKSINKSVRKKDAMQLLTGKPVYTDDVTPSDALVVKILRSPHANAIVQEINTKAAKLVPGVVDIYTWEDVPKNRFAIAWLPHHPHLLPGPLNRGAGLWPRHPGGLQPKRAAL